MLQPIPQSAIIAHYAMLKNGSYAVVTPWGKVLAPSFYELRKSHAFYMSINGAGGWVVLLPKQAAPVVTQARLF